MDWEDALHIVGLGAMFWLGGKAGENRATQAYMNERKDQELKDLREEIEKLKMAQLERKDN
jgi:hypothetical protein